MLSLKLIRISNNRSRASHGITMVTGKEMQADVIATVEPNKKAIKKQKWYADIRENAAVHICHRHLKIKEIQKEEGFCVTEFVTFTMVCGY